MPEAPAQDPPPAGLPAPHVHDTGEGPALLLLHAFPQDASMWDHQVAALSGRFRCLRPDFWGCGASPPPPEGVEVTLDDYAAAVLAALDRLGVDRFAVAGCSMGGYTAMALLARAPERVTAAALIATRSSADSDDAREERRSQADRALREGVEFLVEPTVQRLLSPRGRNEAHISDPVRGRIRRCSGEGVAAAQRAMASRPDSGPLLSGLSLATLVIAGDHDAVVGLSEQEAMAASIPEARLEVIEGAGHLCGLEEPMRVNELLGSFLDTSLQ